MKYALKKSILQFSIVSATTAIALSTTTNAWSANLSFVSSRAALGANDFVDWNPTTNPITLNSTNPAPANFSIQSAGGLKVTGTLGGEFGPTAPNTANVRQQSSTVGLDSPPGGNATYRQDGSDTGAWNGNFAGGDYVFWNNRGNGKLTLSFATPVSAVGTQLDSSFYSNYSGSTGRVEDFIGTITANYGNGLSKTFSANGRTSALADNSARFFGVSSDSADITSVVFNTFDIPTTAIDSTTGLPLGDGYFNYAINRVSIRTTAVPEPFSILGTLFGSAAALKMRKRFKATNKL
jgi:hypothetical protein